MSRLATGPTKSFRSTYLPLLILIVVLISFPIAFSSAYYLSIMNFIAINVMLALGLCLLLGYAGQISLGQSAFYGLGAYLSGILTARQGLNPWLAIVVAAVLTGVVAYILGRPVLRLRGHHLVMATFALAVIAVVFFTELHDITGGPSGLLGIPRLSIGEFTFASDVSYYYLVWTAAVIALIVSLNVVRSRVGRALTAIRGSEVAAEAMGVDVTKHKIQVFVLAAIFSSVAGSLYAHYLTFLNPSPFGLTLDMQLLVMCAVGGLASVWGSAFGAAIITVLSEVIRGIMSGLMGGASGEYEIIVYGIMLILILMFLPDGLLPGISSWLKRRSRTRALDPTPRVAVAIGTDKRS